MNNCGVVQLADDTWKSESDFYVDRTRLCLEIASKWLGKGYRFLLLPATCLIRPDPVTLPIPLWRAASTWNILSGVKEL